MPGRSCKFSQLKPISGLALERSSLMCVSIYLFLFGLLSLSFSPPPSSETHSFGQRRKEEERKEEKKRGEGARERGVLFERSLLHGGGEEEEVLVVVGGRVLEESEDEEGGLETPAAPRNFAFYNPKTRKCPPRCVHHPPAPPPWDEMEKSSSQTLQHRGDMGGRKNETGLAKR